MTESSVHPRAKALGKKRSQGSHHRLRCCLWPCDLWHYVAFDGIHKSSWPEHRPKYHPLADRGHGRAVQIFNLCQVGASLSTLKSREEGSGSGHHNPVLQPQRKSDGCLIKQKLLGQAGMASGPLTATTCDVGGNCLDSPGLCPNYAVGVVCAEDVVTMRWVTGCTSLGQTTMPTLTTIASYQPLGCGGKQ